MKSKNQNKSFNNWVSLLPIFIVSIVGVNFAQVNTKHLENEVKYKIASNYEEPFKFSADQNGVITISGEVKSLFDKLKIAELASQLNGVKGINNKIEVIVEPTADAMIKANIENEFQLNNVILEPEKIMVNVTKGIVNLSGTVSYFREKLMAQSIASWQDGVVDMTSSIKVLSHTAAISDGNLKKLIADILNYHFSSEKNVKFSVSNGNVTLNGTVKSIYAKDHIQEEVQHLLGVINVTNNFSLENEY